MENKLGKRNQRDEDDQSDSENEQQNVESSESEEDEDNYPRKRQRHNSDDSQVGDQDGQQYQDLDGEGDQNIDYDQYDEEALLMEQARLELLQEDEVFKHLSKEELQKILDEADQIEEVKLDKAGVRKIITGLKNKLNENQEKRLQFKDNPEQFMESEAELHSSIKQIQSISAYPQNIPDFIANGGVDALIEVLDHQNPDIAVESVILLTELIDEELLNNNPELKQIVTILINNEVWNFMIRLMQKLDDNDEDERKQIFRCLSFLENLLDADQKQVSNKLMHIDILIDWFLLYLERGDVHSENYLQSAELLFTILQNSHDEYKSKFSLILNGMERILGILNNYRKDRKIELEEEHEALVNLIDIICTLTLIQENLDKFRKLQAFELLTSLSKKQPLLRRHIVKLFDYTLASYSLDCKKNCRYFVEQAGGVPLLFGIFMMKAEEQQKKALKKTKKSKSGDELFIKLSKDDFQEDELRILNLIQGLIINTIPEDETSSTVLHDRILFKFIENNYEKLQRLFELHFKYFSKVEDFDLSKFETDEEIQYLIDDYTINILFVIDSIICMLWGSQHARKLSEGDAIDDKINEFMKFNGIKKETISDIIRLYYIHTKENVSDDNNILITILDRTREQFMQ